MVARRQRGSPTSTMLSLNFYNEKILKQKIHEWKPKGATLIFAIFLCYLLHHTRTIHVTDSKQKYLGLVISLIASIPLSLK